MKSCCYAVLFVHNIIIENCDLLVAAQERIEGNHLNEL